MQYLRNPDLAFHPNTPGHWQGNPFKGNEFKYERNPFRPDWSVLLKGERADYLGAAGVAGGGNGRAVGAAWGGGGLVVWGLKCLKDV